MRLLLLSLLFCLPAFGKTKVAVIDTGEPSFKFNKCSPTIDLTKTGIQDTHGHGSSITALIQKYAGDADYCITHYKFYNSRGPELGNLRNTIVAIALAIDTGANVIVYAGGGVSPSNMEKNYILKALDKGIKIVVAAGNEGSNLDEKCNYFPACYDKRIVVVGNSRFLNVPVATSNRGKIVDYYENGYKRSEGLVKGSLTGTSQATAIRAGKIIKSIDRK